MRQASASWGYLRLSLLSLLVLGLAPGLALAQAGAGAAGGAAKGGAGADASKAAGKAAAKPGAPAAKGAPGAGGVTKGATGESGKTAADDTPEEQEKKGVVDATKIKKTTLVYTYKDPRAEKLLDVDRFKEMPVVRGAPNAQEVKNMATGAASVNTDQITRFVQAQAAILTNHGNLKALGDEAQGPAVQRHMKDLDAASTALIDPLVASLAGNNPQFRRDYSRALLATMPKLLDNHLYARSQAMVVLGTLGESDAMPIYIKQLQDPDQITYVKLWAARGITAAAQNGKRKLEVGRANDAAKTLSDFLQREPEIDWPTQMRALEALGSIRLATDTKGQGQAEMASTALRFLADRKANPEVRSMAAWALGMMDVPSSMAKYNYPLVAYMMGQAALDMGEEAHSSSTSNPDSARHLAALIVYRVLPGLRGDESIRDSGLQHASGIAQARKPVDELTTRVQNVAVAAFNLTSPAAGGKAERARWRDRLRANLAALKEFMTKNPPAENRLVPGGEEFSIGKPEQVAAGDQP